MSWVRVSSSRRPRELCQRLARRREIYLRLPASAGRRPVALTTLPVPCSPGRN